MNKTKFSIRMYMNKTKLTAFIRKINCRDYYTTINSVS